MNKCLECGKDVKNRFCDRTCQNRYYWKKPEYREKTLKMMSNIWLDKEYHDKMTKSRKKTAIDRWKDENQRLQHSRIRRAYCDSDRGKKQLIDSGIKRSIEKPESWGKNNYNSGYYLSKKNNCKIYYASSYEKQAFEILEQLDEVKYYNRCKFSIDYMNPKDNFMHKYIPDIEVIYQSGKRQIIEIKAKWQLEDEINKAKFAAAKERFGNEYIIWTEKELL